MDQTKAFPIYGPRFSSNLYGQEGTVVLRTTDISERGKVDRQQSLIDELEMQVEANLKRVFEGKLAPQDPNDEPASVLLERVRHTKLREMVVNSLRRTTGASAGKRHPQA